MTPWYQSVTRVNSRPTSTEASEQLILRHEQVMKLRNISIILVLQNITCLRISMQEYDDVSSQ